MSHDAKAQPSYYTDANLTGVLVTEALAGRYRWAKGLGWMGWDGRCWALRSDEQIAEVARLWAWTHVEAATKALRTGTGTDIEVRRWIGVAAAGKIRALVGLAKGVEGDVHTDANAFDAHPHLLNTANCVVDLRSDQQLAHDPNLLLTRCTRVGYVPGATHPDWAAVLEAIPVDCRDYVQVRFGQAITGHPPDDDVLLVQQGSGENGKTTFMGAIASALLAYYTHISDRVLLGNPNDHPTELMELRGARLGAIEETPEVGRLDVARLKRTVGTPKITARHIRQDSVTFNASHTLVVSSNYAPIVAETDHGTWRRLLLLKFPFTFKKAHEPLESATDLRGDPGLRNRVATDDAVAEAVLAWLVSGAVTWHALGRVMPAPPARIAADSRSWRRDSDQLLGYCEENLVADPSTHVMSTELLQHFNEWLQQHGHRPWSDKTFAARFAGSDALGARIEKRTQRLDGHLSRPSTTWPMAAVKLSYKAWLGVRFLSPAEQLAPGETYAQAPNSGAVTAVTATSVNPLENSLAKYRNSAVTGPASQTPGEVASC